MCMYIRCTPNPPVHPHTSVFSATKSKFGFEIPSLWRPSVMNAIKEKRLTSDVRNEISRDLITLLYTYEVDPCAAHCKKIAALLVAKYPFMCDGPETGTNKAVSIVPVAQ